VGDAEPTAVIRPAWDHIVFQARLRPAALAVWGPGGAITYQALIREVDGLATELLERNLTRQDLVGIEMGFTYLHLLLILALDRLTIPSLSFTVRDAVSASSAELAALGMTTMISSEAAPSDPPCRWIAMAEQHRPKTASPDSARLARLDSSPEDLVRLMWSSGTTGGAKASPVTRTLQQNRAHLRRLSGGFGPRTRYFAGMPFSTAVGYTRLFGVLSAGGAIVLPNPSIDFVTLANALGVTTTTGAPAMLAELLGRDGGSIRRLETMPVFEVLGEHLPAALARDARLFLTPNLRSIYGSTETDQVAMADAAIAMNDPSAVGFVMPWIDAEIVDVADRPLPFGQEGRLRVRGDPVIPKYYRNEAATRRNFRDGWFYLGDLGVITPDRLLRVTGRVEDMITREGISLSPLPLEEMIRGVPGVRDVAVFMLANAGDDADICAALVLEPGAESAKTVPQIRTRLGGQAPARMFVLDRLPRNATGKVRRRELAEMAQRSVKL
jgi:acyl-CoA synthetase (AMP-forming)/AMP-acid ligase II